MISTYHLSLRYISVSFLFINRSLSTVAGLIFTWILLGETISLKSILSCFVVLIGFFIGLDQESMKGNYLRLCNYRAPRFSFWAPKITGKKKYRFGHRNSRFGHRKLQVKKNIDSGTEILVLGTRILVSGTNLRAPKYVNLGTEILVSGTKNLVSGSKIYV
jgi:hypothetical protein